MISSTVRIGFTVVTAAALSLSAFQHVHAAEVDRIILAKGQTLVQTNAGQPSLDTSPDNEEGSYVLFASVRQTALGSVTSVVISNRLGSEMLPISEEGREISYGANFTTKGDLDDFAPPGTYSFHIDSETGTRVVSVALPSDAYPNHPHIANWAEAQALDSLEPFLLRWDPFAGGRANDFVQVTLDGLEDDEDGIFQTPDVFIPGALNGRSNSVAIPAGTLRPGWTYSGELLFANVVSIDTTSSPGTTNLVAFLKFTRFTLTTAPVPSEGRIQFDGAEFAGAEGEDNATVRLVRLGGSEGEVSVRLSTANLTAVAGQDYEALVEEVTFDSGVTNVEVTIPILDDFILEGPETVRLTLSDVEGGAELGRATNAVLTIADDEASASGVFQFRAATFSGSEGAGGIPVTITRSGGSATEVSVLFRTLDEGGSAEPGVDYTPTNGVLIFGSGVTARTVTIPIVNDAHDETNEVIQLALSSPTGGAALGPRHTASVIINDDDAGGALTFSAALFPVSETNGTAAVVVRRASGVAGGVTVDLLVIGGSATFTNDYSMASSNLTLHFAAGETARTNLVVIHNDALPEGDETVLLGLRNPTGGARLGAITNATLSIIDDEVTLQFVSEVQTNLESGPVAMIVVERSGPPGLPVSVDFATIAGGSATAGADYLTTNGTLTLPAGARMKAFPVRLINDALVEEPETIRVRLSNPSPNAALGNRTEMLLAIRDNDAGGTLRFAVTNLHAKEGRTAMVIVTRTMGLASNVTVRIRTSQLTATDGSDYTGFSSNLVFNAKEVKKILRLPILDDALDEETEQFRVTLDSATGGAQVGDRSTLTVNITDNDMGGIIAFARSEYSANENAGAANILVTRTRGAASNVTVRFTMVPGSNNPAMAGLDYTNVDQTLTFGTNQLSQVIQVPLADDALPDGNKTLQLALRDPTGGARLALSNAVLRLLDDESSVALDRAEYEVSESARLVNITVIRTGATLTTARVDFATSDPVGLPTAEAGTDYLGTNFTLVLPPGVGMRLVPLRILTDTLDETNEMFLVRLRNPNGTQLGSVTNAVVTIHDDDTAGAIQFSATSYSVTEGTAAAQIKVVRFGGAAGGVTIRFATGGGSASAGDDYISVTTNLTFAAGETMKTVLVPIVADVLDESAETVQMALTSPGGGAILGSNNTAVLTINNRPDPDAVSLTGPEFLKVVSRGVTNSTFRRTFNASTFIGASPLIGGSFVIQGHTSSFDDVLTTEGFVITMPISGIGSVAFDHRGPVNLLYDRGSSSGVSFGYVSSDEGDHGTAIIDDINETRFSGRVRAIMSDDEDPTKFIEVMVSFRVNLESN